MKNIKMTPANRDIRAAVEDAGFYLWQIAERLGITDSTFSRKLRRELSDEQKATIFQLIDQLKKERIASMGD